MRRPQIESGFYYLQSRYYDPNIGRFVNVDSQVEPNLTGGLNLFSYCENNPVNCIDPDGHAFMFVTAAIGAVVGAVVGAVKAVKSGKNVLAGAAKGAVVGGLTGLGFGAVAGVALAGSAMASTTAVATGAKALAAIVGGSGIAAGAKMIADNVTQAVSKTPQVFWSGGSAAKSASVTTANSVGGTTLEMTRLGQYLESTNAPIRMWSAASTNFANVAVNSSSSIYSIQNAAGVKTSSIWATVEYPLLSECNIIYGTVMADGVIKFTP